MLSLGTLAIALLLLGTFVPLVFSGGFSRFCLKLLLALCLAVFLFVVYPENLRLAGIPGIDLAFQVGGPIALFFVTFWFVNKYMPDDRGKLFYAIDGAEIEHQIVLLEPSGPVNSTDPGLYKVIDRDPNRKGLVGVYVEFDSSSQSRNVTVISGPDRKNVVPFDLYGSSQFRLRPAQQASNP